MEPRKGTCQLLFFHICSHLFTCLFHMFFTFSFFHIVEMFFFKHCLNTYFQNAFFPTLFSHFFHRNVKTMWNTCEKKCVLKIRFCSWKKCEKTSILKMHLEKLWKKWTCETICEQMWKKNIWTSSWEGATLKSLLQVWFFRVQFCCSYFAACPTSAGWKSERSSSNRSEVDCADRRSI